MVQPEGTQLSAEVERAMNLLWVLYLIVDGA